VPVSIRRPEEKGALGNRVSSGRRLHRAESAGQGGPPGATWSTCQSVSRTPSCGCIASRTPCRHHKDSGQAVAAEALAGLAGFAPPTLHALGARVASGMLLLAAYPVVPLAHGQAVSIGVTSYDGRLITASTPTATACPTSECWRSASSTRSASWRTRGVDVGQPTARLWEGGRMLRGAGIRGGEACHGSLLRRPLPHPPA
jgi:hypothetical protein